MNWRTLYKEKNNKNMLFAWSSAMLLVRLLTTVQVFFGKGELCGSAKSVSTPSNRTVIEFFK